MSGTLSQNQRRQLLALQALPDEQIDLSDIPEILNWEGAVRGKFYRPVKQSITIRLDADVLAWWRAQGKGYQSRINQTLRREMVAAHPGTRKRARGDRG